MKHSINRSWVVLLVALSLGGLAAFGVNRYIKRQVDDLKARDGDIAYVLISQGRYSKGHAIDAGGGGSSGIPGKCAGALDALTPDQFDRVENQKLSPIR